MQIILCAVGLMLFLYGAVLFTISNFNLGVMLVIALGTFVLFCGAFYKPLSVVTSHGVWRAAKYTVITCVCAWLLLVGFVAVYGNCDNVTYKEDAVIVLGAGLRGDRVTLPLKYRLDKAIEYSNKNKEAVIVVTGGQGFQETVTEAYAMKKYLISNGVEPSRIVKEGKSTSTNENMRFAKDILDDMLGKDLKVAVITNNFHIYRGTSIAKTEGFKDVTHMGASLQWYNLLPCYMRESLAIIKMWVLG